MITACKHALRGPDADAYAVHDWPGAGAHRHGVWRAQVTVQVCVFAFDLLFVDGEMLVHLPLRQRRIRMAQARSLIAMTNDPLSPDPRFERAATAPSA